MARRYYSSTAARTTLAAGITNVATTVGVTAVSGWPASFPYTIILDQDTINEEIIEVTARTGTTLTVIRGVDGTTAVSHSAGAAVNHGVSARDFDEPNAFINGTGTVTQTLLGTGSVTSAKILDGTIVDADISASAAIAQSKVSGLTSALTAKATYLRQTSTPTGAFNTFWEDTNTTPSVLKIWSGSAWVTFSLGVANANFSNTATGTYSTGGVNYKYIAFTGSGTLTVTAAGFADVVAQAGGGGGRGSGNGSGGGGGGSLIASSVAPVSVYLPVGTYTVNIGAGGPNGTNGSDSYFGSYYAFGGGGGGVSPAGATGGGSLTITPNQPGLGGGQQGKAGGAGDASSASGGGGGVLVAGTNGAANTGGNGGAGVADTIEGSSVTRGGGGGGWGLTTGGTGGAGGGANGSSGASINAVANTGGGGGGSSDVSGGGLGGSGVVIIRVKV